MRNNCQVPLSGLLHQRCPMSGPSPNWSFVYSDFIHSHFGECPKTSTPKPWSGKYSHAMPSPSNLHDDGSLPGLRVFHPNETLSLGLGPAPPRTPPHGSPSPIALMTFPELPQGANGPAAASPPSTTQSDENFHSRTWSQFLSVSPDRSTSDLVVSRVTVGFGHSTPPC